MLNPGRGHRIEPVVERSDTTGCGVLTRIPILEGWQRIGLSWLAVREGEAPAEPLWPADVHPNARLRRSVALPPKSPRGEVCLASLQDERSLPGGLLQPHSPSGWSEVPSGGSLTTDDIPFDCGCATRCSTTACRLLQWQTSGFGDAVKVGPARGEVHELHDLAGASQFQCLGHVCIRQRDRGHGQVAGEAE